MIVSEPPQSQLNLVTCRKISLWVGAFAACARHQGYRFGIDQSESVRLGAIDRPIGGNVAEV